MAGEPWLLVASVPLEEGTVVRLDAEESRHAAGPLRLRSGDLVVLADGHGRLADAELTQVSGRGSEAEIRAFHVSPPPSAGGVTIALAVLHGQAMDWAVAKAVEVGVGTFIPIIAERSQVRSRTARGRLDHWRRIARQALKQCRRPWQMEVADPCSLGALLDLHRHGRGAVADPQGLRPHELTGEPPDLLLVGPEGGFGPSDRELLATLDWPRLSLGDHVLRAETAAIVGGAVLISARDRRHSE